MEQDETPSSLRPARPSRLRFWHGFVAGAFAIVLVASASVAVIAQGELRPRDWLLTAADDTERWSLLQAMFGGFAPAMTQVADHYRKAYDAIIEGNYELAQWQWGRVKTAIDLGTIRRPARRPNAEAIFLSTAWVALDEALAAEDGDAAREAFSVARAACVACHIAEGRPYFNEQALFRDTASFPDR